MSLLLCSTIATAVVLEIKLVYSLDSSSVRVQLGVQTSRPISRDHLCHGTEYNARTPYAARSDAK